MEKEWEHALEWNTMSIAIHNSKTAQNLLLPPLPLILEYSQWVPECIHIGCCTGLSYINVNNTELVVYDINGEVIISVNTFPIVV